MENIIKELENNPYIKVKELADDVKSYNFTRQAFQEGHWNKHTITARGLFVQYDKVIARGYPKFFNIDELPETSWTNLLDSFEYPIKVYRKENGFLGLLSCYDRENLFIASKSTNEGDFAGYFRAALDKVLSESQQKELARHLYRLDCSAVFEVIDPINDPHIVEYYDTNFVLLDIIQNDFEFSKWSYDAVKMFASAYGLYYKIHETTLHNKEELVAFYSNHIDDEYIEGFVFEDSNGFMVKYKTNWYCKWKKLRSLLTRINAGKELLPWQKTYLEAVCSPQEERYFLALGPMEFDNIIELRNVIEFCENEFLY